MSLIPQGEQGPPGPEGPPGPPGSQAPLSTILGIGNSAGTNTINMNNQKIQNLGAPTDGTDATNRSFTDTTYLAKAGGTMSGTLDMGNNFLEGVNQVSYINSNIPGEATIQNEITLSQTADLVIQSYMGKIAMAGLSGGVDMGDFNFNNNEITLPAGPCVVNNLQAGTATDVVYYDPSTKQISYGTKAQAVPPLADVLSVGRTTGGQSIDFQSNTNIENCADGNITNLYTAEISVLPGVGVPTIGVNDTLLMTDGTKLDSTGTLRLNAPATQEIHLNTNDTTRLTVSDTSINLKRQVNLEDNGIINIATLNGSKGAIDLSNPVNSGVVLYAKVGATNETFLSLNGTTSQVVCNKPLIYTTAEGTTETLTNLRGATTGLNARQITIGEAGKTTTLSGSVGTNNLTGFNSISANAQVVVGNDSEVLIKPDGITLSSIPLTGASAIDTYELTLYGGSAGQVLTNAGPNTPAVWADIPVQIPTLGEVMLAGNVASTSLNMYGNPIYDATDVVLTGDLTVASTSKLIGPADSTAAPVNNILARADDGTLSYQLERTEFKNTVYVNDGVNDIQAALDANPSQSVVYYMSAGSFGGATVSVAGKNNIAIVAPNIGPPATICELADGRGLTLEATSQRIRVANLSVKGLMTCSSGGNNYYSGVVCAAGLTVNGSGSHFFYDCEFSGAVSVAPSFAGVVAFIRGNFSGATFSLLQTSPAQVQFAQSLNLPVSRPANAVYGTSNQNTAGVITENLNVIAPVLGSTSFTTTGCATLGATLSLSGQDLSLVSQSGATLNTVSIPGGPTPGLAEVLAVSNSAGANGINMNAQTLSNVQSITSQPLSGMLIKTNQGFGITNLSDSSGLSSAIFVYPNPADASPPFVYIRNRLQTPLVDSLQTLKGLGGGSPLNVDTTTTGTVNFKTGGTTQFHYTNAGFIADNDVDMNANDLIGAASVATQSVVPKAGSTEWTSTGCASLGSDLTYDSGSGALSLLSQSGATLATVSISGGGGGGGGGSGYYLYKTDTNNTTPPPNAGKTIWDAVQASATSITFSHLTDDGVDIDVFLAVIQEGDVLILQDQNNSTQYQKYTVNGTPTQVNNSYYTFPITINESTYTFPDNHPVALIPLLVRGVQTVSGGQGITISGTATNPIVNADVVDIAQGTGITVSETAGTFTINADVVDIQAGTGINVSNASGTFTISSTATTPSLSDVLAVGNSAGTTDINMNQQSITDALTVSTTNLSSSETVPPGTSQRIYVKNVMLFDPTTVGDNQLDMGGGYLNGVQQINRSTSAGPMFITADNADGVVIAGSNLTTPGVMSVGTIKPHPTATTFSTTGCASLGSQLSYIGSDLSLLAQDGTVLDTVVISGGGGGVGSISQVLAVGNDAGGQSIDNLGSITSTNINGTSVYVSGLGASVNTPAIIGTGSTLRVAAGSIAPQISIEGTLTLDGTQNGGTIQEVANIKGRTNGDPLVISTVGLASSTIQFKPANSLALYMDGSQRVGIRTSTPTEALEVNGNIKLAAGNNLLGNASTATTASNITGHTARSIPFYNQNDLLFFAPMAGNAGYIATTDGDVLTFQAPINFDVGSALNVKRGAGLLYNPSADFTTVLSAGTDGQVISWLSGVPVSTSQSALVVGRSTNVSSSGAGIIYNSSANSTNATSGLGTANQVLLSAGGSSAPVWADQSTLAVGSATSATSATNATNITGGAAGNILYQSASGTTAKLANGTAGQVLVQGATNPQWTTVNFPLYYPNVALTQSSTLAITTGTSQTLFRTTNTYTFPIGSSILVRCPFQVATGTAPGGPYTGSLVIQVSTDPNFTTPPATTIAAGTAFAFENFNNPVIAIAYANATFANVYVRTRLLFTSAGFNGTQTISTGNVSFQVNPAVLAA